MEIKKDYELRKCGSKIVVRQLVPPAYEFKTLLVADEQISSPRADLIVLKAEGHYAFLREKDDRLCSVRGCRDYDLKGSNILVLQDIWYWWTEDFKLLPLGDPVGEGHWAFIRKEQDQFVLSFFSEEKFKQVNGTDFQALDGKKIFCLQADVAKMKIDGVCRYLCIASQTKRRPFLKTKLPEYQDVCKVIFSPVPMKRIADYYDFIQEFRQRKSEFGWFISFDEKFRASVWNGRNPPKGWILMPPFGDGVLGVMGVVISVDLQRMFGGETKNVYTVCCSSLNYEKKADDVEMGSHDGGTCLFIRYEGREDIIFCDRSKAQPEFKLIKVESAS